MNLRAFRLLLCLGSLAALLSGGPVQAQTDPPARVARLNHAEGTVTFSPAGDNEWVDAPRNRPLARGDRLWTDRGSRAELQVGSSAIRLNGLTRLEILELDDHSAKLSLLQGSVYVRVRSLPEGENFEIDTPNLAYRAAYPGDYRIDVDAGLGTTRVTIHSGTGSVYGEGGQAQPLGGGQQVTFHGRALAQLEARESPPQDGFDRWAEERNRREDQSITARYVPREVVGYQQLDPHGQWVRDATYGAVWFPQGVAADWAPYRHGHWEWIAPWGWNWIDDAPWGFAPFHYGRWALVGSRWAWVPGRLGLRPVYAPALVAFVGGGRGLLPGTSAPGEVAWFPLAPGEMWQPGFPASAAYISNVNRNMVPGQGDAAYTFQRRREALTAISRDDFHRGRPVAASWLRVAALTLTSATIVPPPPMPQRSVLAAADRSAVPRKAPPPAPSQVRQVAAAAAVPAEPPAGARRAAQATTGLQPTRPAVTPPVLARPASAAPPVAAVQLPATKAAPAADGERGRGLAQQRAQAQRARRTEAAAAATALANARAVATRAETTRRAQAQQREQLARAAQSRRDSAQRAEHKRREQASARMAAVRSGQQARREPLPRREVQPSRDEQRRQAEARRQDQLQREARTRRDEQLRREARAIQVEQVRRAADRDAQALQQQRVQRDEQVRRAAQDREQAQREAWQREQQAAAEQWRRERPASDQAQRPRARPRPSLQPEWRDDARDRPPEVWQRGIPILPSGRTS